MIRIALCDDNLQELDSLMALVEEYKVECSEEIFCRQFISSTELLDTLKKEDFNIVFLDILMPDIDGIKIGKEIRTFDHNIKIIYLTTSPEFALDSYSVNAFYYMLKPIKKKQMALLLDQIIFTCHQQDENSIVIRYKGNVTSISFFQLEGIEAVGKKVCLYLNDGSALEVLGPLAKYEKILLRHKKFIRTHRSFIVNMDKVKMIENRVIITKANHRICISKGSYNAFKTQYMNYLFEKRDFIV